MPLLVLPGGAHARNCWPTPSNKPGRARHSPLAAPLDALDDEARARADLAARVAPGAPSASLSAGSARLHGAAGAQKWEAQVGAHTQAHQVTPRLWKEHFAQHRLRSPIEQLAA